MTNDLQFSTRKTVCPCGHGKDFVPLTSHPTGGKCWANHCGQKFFPPTDGKARGYDATQYDRKPAKDRPKPLPPVTAELPQQIFDNLPPHVAELYERLQLRNDAPLPENNLAELLHYFSTVQVPQGTVSLPGGGEIHNARMFAKQTVRALENEADCPAALLPNIELLAALRGVLEGGLHDA